VACHVTFVTTGALAAIAQTACVLQPTDSICPTCSAEKTSKMRYTLEISQGTENRNTEWQSMPVFFAKGIQGCTVKVTPALKPGIRYYWSVRPSGTEKWSTYNIHDWLSQAALERSSSSYELHFKFYTPRGN